MNLSQNNEYFEIEKELLKKKNTNYYIVKMCNFILKANTEFKLRGYYTLFIILEYEIEKINENILNIVLEDILEIDCTNRIFSFIQFNLLNTFTKTIKLQNLLFQKNNTPKVLYFLRHSSLDKTVITGIDIIFTKYVLWTNIIFESEIEYLTNIVAELFLTNENKNYSIALDALEKISNMQPELLSNIIEKFVIGFYNCSIELLPKFGKMLKKLIIFHEDKILSEMLKNIMNYTPVCLCFVKPPNEKYDITYMRQIIYSI